MVIRCLLQSSGLIFVFVVEHIKCFTQLELHMNKQVNQAIQALAVYTQNSHICYQNKSASVILLKKSQF